MRPALRYGRYGSKRTKIRCQVAVLFWGLAISKFVHGKARDKAIFEEKIKSRGQVQRQATQESEVSGAVDGDFGLFQF